MYHLIYFKMYNSEALKYVDKTVVYNHHHHPSPELFHHAKMKPVCIIHKAQSPTPSPWQPLFHHLSL